MAVITDIENRLTTLETLTTGDLQIEWERLYRASPPIRLSRDLLLRGIAHSVQECALGGLSLSAQRRLRALACGSDQRGRTSEAAITRLKPGTQLVREWRHRVHTVNVLSNGFEYQGECYRSLTGIARRITGVAGRDPAFLGLRTFGRRGKGVSRSKAPPRSGRALRCAIYARKSSEEGLEQEFNSLHAQREACEAFIRSQRQEGWSCLRQADDDGGRSGGNLDRPALQALLAAVREDKVDVVVVYKIDRLTRSLADLPRLSRSLTPRGVVCLGYPAVQHNHLDGPADPQRAVVVCPV
jgi:hypothetical protein